MAEGKNLDRDRGCSSLLPVGEMYSSSHISILGAWQAIAILLLNE